jgi:soluble lytic murein transglycosylase-like protein
VNLKVWFPSCLLGALLLCPPAAPAQLSVLKKAVVLRNQADLERSLQDGSYRGEAGILRLRPEVARSLGMTVFMDQDYLDAKVGFERAESFLDRAKAAMMSREAERAPGTHVREVVENFLEFIRRQANAKEKMALYRTRLAGEKDDRLSDVLSEGLLDRLLSDSFRKAENRLRDGLACLYNACHGISDSESALTPDNVEFVNDVFQHFTKQASKQSLSFFALDRIEDYRKGTDRAWAEAVSDTFQYTTFLEETARKLNGRGCEADPLLFLALIRRESNFDSFAVSSQGAAGLTQMMPGTALDLGVKTVYNPDYLAEALSLSDQERRARAQAMAALYRVNESNPLEPAAKARELMQRAMDLCQLKERLFLRYRNELLESRADDRLNASVAIEFGYKHFCSLLSEHGGDVSLALAAYNAGSSRVKEYGGIPPFAETVRFRNRVLEYYRDYLDRLKTFRKP